MVNSSPGPMCENSTSQTPSLVPRRNRPAHGTLGVQTQGGETLAPMLQFIAACAGIREGENLSLFGEEVPAYISENGAPHNLKAYYGWSV